MQVQMNSSVFDATGVSRISDNFVMHYVCDEVSAIQAVWALVDDDQKEQLRTVLQRAKECVNSWTIYDECDRQSREMVLQCVL
jgi:hypothetical protein